MLVDFFLFFRLFACTVMLVLSKAVYYNIIVHKGRAL
jgi:hypothetical protein